MENINLIENSLNKFGNADELYEYIKNYLINSGIVSVSDVSDTIKGTTGLKHIFAVDFMNQFEANGNQKRYYVFVCPLNQDLTNLIGKIQTGLNSVVPHRKVAFGYFNYDYTTKNMAKSVGLDLVGYSDILDINESINNGMRVLPYFNLNNDFASMLAKNLNAKAKFTCNSGTGFASSIGNDINNQLSELGGAFTEGFNQLKESLSGIFGKKTPVNNNFGQATEQQTTNTTFENTSSVVPPKVDDTVEQVANEPIDNIDAFEDTKTTKVNLEKEPEEKAEDKHISLKKD